MDFKPRAQMNSLVKCVGFPSTQLSAAQIQKVNAFIASQPEGAVLQVELFPNLDTTNDESHPSGMSVLFNPSATVDATLVSDNLFQTMAVSKVYAENVSDATFKGMESELLNAVKQFPADAISGKVHNKETNQELKPWSPELGGTGSFVGVYSRINEDHRSKDYFISGRAAAPLYTRDVKQSLAALKEPITYQQLLSDDHWAKLLGAAKLSAKRNLCRSMINVAETCGVEIRRQDDIWNGIAHVNADAAVPEMATPEWIQVTNDIYSTTFENKPAVAFSYGVVPIHSCYHADDNQFFVVSNPYDGISSFNLSRHQDMHGLSGLPADTGRAVAAESISTQIGDYKDRMHGIVWEKGAATSLVGDAHHIDLHPAAFRPIDAQFKGAMKTMGWNPEHHVQKLVCVMAKIYNPELRRQ